jgi:hypothetical protein
MLKTVEPCHARESGHPLSLARMSAAISGAILTAGSSRTLREIRIMPKAEAMPGGVAKRRLH